MKKLLSALLCMTMICVIAGCSSKEPTPSDAAKAFLDAYKSQNSEEVNKYTVKEFSQDDLLNLLDDTSDFPEESMTGLKDAFKKIVDVDYTLNEETVNEEKATVAVSITSYPLGETFKTWAMEAIMTALASAFDESISEEALNKQLADSLVTKLSEMEKTYKKDVVINLVKVDDAWKIDNDTNADLLDALSGGFSSIDKSSLDMSTMQ